MKMLGEDVIQGADIEEVVNYIVPVLQRREGELTIQNQTDLPLSLTQPVLQSLIQVFGIDLETQYWQYHIIFSSEATL